jgi:hypothetical protein
MKFKNTSIQLTLTCSVVRAQFLSPSPVLSFSLFSNGHRAQLDLLVQVFEPVATPHNI